MSTPCSDLAAKAPALVATDCVTDAPPRVAYSCDMQRVKLADVARAAGVHPGTASRALNPATRDQVSRATSKRVARAAERLGYVPNSQARGLRTARSYIVGMV